MNTLNDKQKGILLSLSGILIITPDSLFIRLVKINSWELVFYRGIIPFLCLFLGLLIYYNKNFIKYFLAIGFYGVLNAIIVAATNVTFIVSLENTKDLYKKIPNDITIVAESGIKDGDDLNFVADLGYDGVLVGTSLMKTGNPGHALEVLIKGLR